MKLTYSLKEDICVRLSDLGKKHISEEDIVKMEKKFNIPEKQHNAVLRAWTNFVQTGGKTVDRRTMTPSNKQQFAVLMPSHTGYYKINHKITRAKAGKIIKEYMQTDITSRKLSRKYKVSLNQFYDWIRELEVKGTLLGIKVLDPKKYAKVRVVDAIWLKKYPKTTRKTITSLSKGEYKYLERVGDVLESYL